MMLIFLLGIVSFIVWIYALVDALTKEFKNPNDKLLWVLLILLLHFVGALIYLFYGRKHALAK